MLIPSRIVPDAELYPERLIESYSQALMKIQQKYGAPPEVANMTAEEFYESSYVQDGRAQPERSNKNGFEELERMF
jgi:hypothetical protein